MDRIRPSYVTALAIGVTALAFTWWRWRKNTKLPNKWRKVGELSDIFVFPVKSFGYIKETEVECTQLGCKKGWLRDRTLMVTQLDGRFITARKYPQMVLVTPSIEGSVLTLSAPGMTNISIDLAEVRNKMLKVVIWGQSTPASDCGDEVARWISRFLVQEDTGFRLVYYPLEKPSRDGRKHNRGFPLIENSHIGAFPDETSFSLMNKASVDDLNDRLEEPVTALNFRLNFLVEGAKPLEEDTWKWVKIGDVIFRNIRPCTRCLHTTIDPNEGVKHPKMEPLVTLRKYRNVQDPALRRFTGDSPVMGIHLGLKGPSGNVKIGDPIYVNVPEKDDLQ
ncbi:mitochondrial amidoxime-reducing component 1 [Microplitis demolitor]|uniref:mitochondrial amidoxime-reducing component 1 n=1 Tax=Microplitis demolitor TaxID=69319 RepID=UPI0004CDB19B|nr:mitochondrial amidoxime-reducing component 1 [Microplitis demolitor]